MQLNVPFAESANVASDSNIIHDIKVKRKGTSKKLVSNSERLPTNTLSTGNRIQRWANFIAGFSIEFVEQCLVNRNPKEDVVLEPFLGCGTTLVGAKNKGFKGVGIEAHPLFFNLASAKLGSYRVEDVESVLKYLCTKENKIAWSESALEFINKMFSESNQALIQFSAYQIGLVPERLRPLAIAVFLKASELSCTAQTDGIYKAPDSKKKSISFDEALISASKMFVDDVASDWYKEHWATQLTPSLFHQSSEKISEVEDNSVGVCITSPPYLNNFDYAEMTRLQLYLLGWADSWGDISEKVRNKLITNTTTALKDKKTAAYQSLTMSSLPNSLATELTSIVTELQEQRKNRAGKKEYDYLVYPYYHQIDSVLREIYRTLKEGGEVNWVVADAALYGVHIKTHEHTKTLMESIGFKNVEIRWMRQRGHRWILSKRDGAKEALGEYHLFATK